MKNYIKEFNHTGNSIIDVDLVCREWNNKFTILSWITDTEEKYTFVVSAKAKDKTLCKTQISKEQANEIISNLNLKFIKDTTFRSAGAYRSESNIIAEFARLSLLKEEKLREIRIIDDVIESLRKAL